VREGAIVFDELSSVDQLPRGISEQQAPGSYRLNENGSQRYFAWANGPQAIKPMVFAPREALWSCEQGDDGAMAFQVAEVIAQPLAVLGARPCDVAALYIQDRHFLQQQYQDPYYLTRRQQLLLIAVNCTHPADTCFCASTGDGPRVHFGHDLALTELEDGFLVEVHSEQGKAIRQQLALQEASPQQRQQVDDDLARAAQSQQRHLASRNYSDALFANLHHPRWQEVGSRCLSCGNCTAVCPTCFCHNETETPHISGKTSTHYREWDSCFTQGHSYIHGITIRAETPARYRQWLTHKLGSWHEQYGRSGCVGCGRCITWCPVGIDITEEVAAICDQAPTEEAS
jgi:sulfhydrogenase subunit beta (sulfur reductase)